MLLTLALLLVYMVSTFFTLLWLACPFYGNLARFMGNYQVETYCEPNTWDVHLLTETFRHLSPMINAIVQEELRKAAEETGQETEARSLLGELFEIYYDNRSQPIKFIYGCASNINCKQKHFHQRPPPAAGLACCYHWPRSTTKVRFFILSSFHLLPIKKHSFQTNVMSLGDNKNTFSKPG